MQKIETLDGYHVYNVKKEKKYYYLADKNDYKKDINDLLKTVNDIKFDSLIIIFGIDTGEYLDDLYNVLCKKNRILIFEPNKEIFNEKQNTIGNDNVRLVFYDKNSVKLKLYSVINITNFNNLYVHAFGNYSRVYREEYEIFMENLECVYYTACSSISIANRFREVFIKNLIANLKSLKSATPLNSYENINRGIPAIIVSAGPSLDKNLAEMMEYKDELDKYFIIAGNRTLGAMLKNGIRPDMVVSIDPVNDNYDMMEDYLDEDIPLVFYEYSNRYLIRDYKGEKIYLSTLLSKTIPKLCGLKGVYLGGSVAHTCVDIANIMGCSPLILVGQDFAFTYGKHHSDLAIFDSDKKNNYNTDLTVKDIFGDKIKTNVTLNQFRAKIEEYIKFHSEVNNIEFINASYGAEIKGAPHKELCDVFKIYDVHNRKKSCIIDKSIEIHAENMAYDILNYVEKCIDGANKGEELCKDLLSNESDKSLMDMDEDDEELKKFLYIMAIVNNFESSPGRLYLGGYFNKFLFDIKEETFNMYAKDYDSLTSSLRYQSKCFLVYFEKMNDFLKEIKSLILETLSEFY
ncbi:motility associated factor glycosyltransferase family protein [Clostridium sp. WILCCON 0269]|uniref:Motility associated factor glycosyltransferase family protein n=1 Tax=Candidatus Clostridium eludens TaxID=3381663 RepID=A0ABW8SPM8_9CLOT